MKKQSKNTHVYLFFFLLILFIAVRVFVLFSGNVFHSEECYVGTIANEIARGSRLEWYEMPFDEYQLGTAFDAYFSSIFYSLGDFKYMVKVWPLLLSTMFFFSFYALTRKFYSRFVHIFANLLIVFAPKEFLRINLLNGTADFLPLVFYGTLVMLLTFEILRQNRIKYYILLGFLGGFGFCYNYAAIIPLIISLFVLTLYFGFRKRTIYVITSAFIGALPFWVYRLGLSVYATNKIRDQILYFNLGHTIHKLLFILRTDYFNSFGLSSQLNFVYGLLFAFGLIGSLIYFIVIFVVRKKQFPSFENLRLLFPILLILLFFLTYATTKVGDFQIKWYVTKGNSIYFSFIVPFLILATIEAMSRLIWSSKYIKVIYFFLLLILGLISIKSTCVSSNCSLDIEQTILNYCYNGSPYGSPLLGFNVNSPGNRFYLAFEWGNRDKIGPSYPIYLCSKLSDESKVSNCVKIVLKHFKKRVKLNTTPRVLCTGPTRQHNEVCQAIVETLN